MIIVLVIAVWIALLSLVAGLCAAARVGDRSEYARARWERARPQPSRAANAVELYARADVLTGRAAKHGAPALQSEGVAA